MLALGTGVCFASENAKIAVIPLVNTAFADGSRSGDFDGYNYQEILQNSYNNSIDSFIKNNSYRQIDPEIVSKELQHKGYDIYNLDSISVNDIVDIGKITDADITLYIEPLKFTSLTSLSNRFYSSTRCVVYSKQTNSHIAFKINFAEKKGGSIFHSQSARSKGNAAIFMDATFEKVLNRVVELGMLDNLKESN